MRYSIGLREANHHLAKHIKAVEEGHEVIITRRGQPVARLTATSARTGPRTPSGRQPTSGCCTSWRPRPSPAAICIGLATSSMSDSRRSPSTPMS